MRIIAVVNQKGGVGKTTTAVNLGDGLNRLRKKVLLIDLDPQAHLTFSLSVPEQKLEKSVYEVLSGGISFNEAITHRDGGLDVIPSSLKLSGAELEFSGIKGREFLLKESLSRLKGYDYIFIDCSPSLGLLTVNALTTAKEVYIPLTTEFLSLQGLSKLLQTVEVIKGGLNKGIEITGIIATRYNKRKKLNQEVVEKIREYFGNKLFKTYIRENISLAEAPGFGKTIFEYKPKSRGAEDYLSLSRKIAEGE